MDDPARLTPPEIGHGCKPMHQNVVTLSLLCVFMIMMTTHPIAGAMPELDRSLGAATAAVEGDRLIVSTGRIQRTWRLTGRGLATVGLTDLRSGRRWADAAATADADWSFPGFIEPDDEAKLVSLTAAPGDDDGFTGEHLEVVAEFEYPSSGAAVRYVVWAYPDAPGLRTQLFVKRLDAEAGEVAAAPDHPMIEVVTGRGYIAPGSAEVAGEAMASNLNHGKSVELHAKGLDARRRYVLGLSWWDWGGAGREQQVRVTSVDGETEYTIIPPTVLPAWKGKGQRPAELTAPAPGEVMLDDTFRVLIDKVSGVNANVSEVWLYESVEDDADADAIPVAGPAARIAAIAAKAPAGYRLAAYLNAGADYARVSRDDAPTARVDFLPLVSKGVVRRYLGYFNDMQNRNRPDTPVLREQVEAGSVEGEESVGWANMVSIEDGDAGVVVLKESHKCANQSGVDTGAFLLDDAGLHNTGAGRPLHADTSDFQWCWASWCIVYDGGDLGRQLAIKAFDRARYPVDLKTDMHMFSVLWYDSSEDRGRWHRGGNWQDEVLRDMAANAELGIDCVIIDDGWYHGKDRKQWRGSWRPHPEPWPSGWAPAVQKKRQLGLELGLWGIAQHISAEDMLWNWRQLGMIIFKLDFAGLDTRRELDEMIDKSRAFVAGADHTANVLWDNTENAPRFGYYWLRETGVLHSMNRKHLQPAKVTYIPWITLRDIWLLGKYQNLNQILLTTCIPSRVNPDASDARRHGADYAMATTLMGIPQIQASVRDYSSDEKRQLQRLIPVYKQHREAIFTSYVVPIGDEPSNRSWTGFQALRPDRDDGRLLIFRELHNDQPEATLKLEGVAGRTLTITDLLSGRSRDVTASASGEVMFEIPEAPGFLFLSYEIKSSTERIAN